MTTQMANFVIGGTEKAGTTSVFTYLSAHPQVCGSSVKETNFFRDRYTGKRDEDIQRYQQYFDRCEPNKDVLMEASPGYLGAGSKVAARMGALIPDTRILFILRDPIDRLYSSYNFHLGKLDIDASISFENYIEKCLKYENSNATPEELGVGEWFLKTPGYGKYGDFISHFYNCFPAENIKVMFFEKLNADNREFMIELCDFLDIDSDFFNHYEFKKVNVTFSGKNKAIHKAAVKLNAMSESFLRQRPRLKQSLVGIYKKFNQAREGYDEMPASVRAKLEEYYRESNEKLAKYTNASDSDWLPTVSHQNR